MTGSNLSLTNYHVNTLTDFYAAKASLNDSLKIVQSCKQFAFNTLNAFMVGQSTALISANLQVESCKRRLNRPVDELSSLPVLFEPASPRKAQGLLPQL